MGLRGGTLHVAELPVGAEILDQLVLEIDDNGNLDVS